MIFQKQKTLPQGLFTVINSLDKSTEEAQKCANQRYQNKLNKVVQSRSAM